MAVIVFMAVFFYLLFQLVTPVRIGGWGAVAVHDSFLTGQDRPENVLSWALCTELELVGNGTRALPITPILVGTPKKLLRAPPVTEKCAKTEDVKAHFLKTRFRFDRELSLVANLAFPIVFFIVLLALRANLTVSFYVLACASIAPFLYDAASSLVWTNSAYLFPGQHIFVAKTFAQTGTYGWTANQMVAYGMPKEAVTAWAMSDTPSPSGWTYPGYTLVLAGLFRMIFFFGNPTDLQLTIVAIILNFGMTLLTLFLIFHIASHILGSRLTATAPVYLISLSGWPWALCPFPASEPMQALIIVASIALAFECEKRGREFAVPALFALAALAGIGQITKPILGLLPSLFLLAFTTYRYWNKNKKISQKSKFICFLGLLLLVVSPTLMIGIRNYLTFGQWVFSSTVGGVFLAQGLDLGMEMPRYFGNSELAYGAASLNDIRDKISLFLINPEYRWDLISQKVALIVSSITGLNYVTEVGRMGNDGYSGVNILLVSLSVAYGVFSFLNPLSLSIERVLAIVFAFTIAICFLTQPLGRYLIPISICYPIFVARLVVFSSNEWSQGRRRAITMIGVLAVIFTVFFGLAHAKHGWF